MNYPVGKYNVLLKQALIIFVRNPVPGKVKTRIAKTAGDSKAVAIYIELLHHTRAVTYALHADKYIFYADEITPHDLWSQEYIKYLQLGSDLGERMKNAFDFLFRKEYEHICIIGSDCFALTPEIINEAFNALHHNDVAIGPSEDGGYYLLGLRSFNHSLFNDIDWSTGKVLKQTLEKCVAKNLNYQLLPTLNDIDDEADWLKHLNEQQT